MPESPPSKSTSDSSPANASTSSPKNAKGDGKGAKGDGKGAKKTPRDVVIPDEEEVLAIFIAFMDPIRKLMIPENLRPLQFLLPKPMERNKVTGKFIAVLIGVILSIMMFNSVYLTGTGFICCKATEGHSVQIVNKIPMPPVMMYIFAAIIGFYFGSECLYERIIEEDEALVFDREVLEYEKTRSLNLWKDARNWVEGEEAARCNLDPLEFAKKRQRERIEAGLEPEK